MTRRTEKMCSIINRKLNTAKEDSDIGILVTFAAGSISFDHYMDLKLFLENLFQRKVDLVIEEDIRQQLKESILSSVVYAA